MHKKFLTVISLIVFVISSSALAADILEEDKSPVETRKLSETEKRVYKAALGDKVNGEKLLKMNCAACHGIFQRGQGSLASKLNPPPADLRDGVIMNMLSHEDTIKIIKKGGAKMGKSSLMPAFEYSFDQLQLWDLVSYLRTLYPHVEEFYPKARFYIAKEYTIGDYGKKRLEKALKKKLPESDYSLTVFTVYKKPDLAAEGPVELVPQLPSKLDALKKKYKLGYLMFVNIKMDGKMVPLALRMDNAGRMTKLLISDLTLPNAAKLNKLLAKFEGKGRRGGAYSIKKVAIRDRKAKKYTKEIYKIWLRTLEACFMFENEERERSWADDSFGPKKEEKMPDVDFKVK